MRILIDYETFSRCELRTEGTYNYFNHSSTEVLCFAYVVDNGETKLWLPGDPEPNEFAFADEFVAFNANFERLCHTKLFVEKLGWKPIERWTCLAVRSAQHGIIGSLDDVTKAFGLNVNKDMAGHRVMMKLCKPKKPSKTDPTTLYTKESHPELYDKLYEYCVKDIDAEKALMDFLDQRGHSTNMEEYWVDQEINDLGVPIDMNLVNRASEIVRETFDRNNKKIMELTNGEIKSANQVAAIKRFCKSHGMELDSLSAATVDSILSEADTPKPIREILTIRKALSKGSVKKLNSAGLITCNDNRARGLLKYHAAHTGRWGGRYIQLQNLPRGSMSSDLAVEQILNGEVEGDPLETVSSSLRGMIAAEPDHKLLVGDFAGIEARDLLWLAGETAGVEAFRNNVDIYKTMAAKIYHVGVDEVTKEQRTLGKVAILGLGYGMSASKFISICESYGMEISEELAQKVVDIYRDEYWRVVDLWKSLEQLAITACWQPNVLMKDDKLGFIKEKDFLYMILPSGRRISYFKPRVNDVETPWGETKPQLSFIGRNTYTRKFERVTTYGGKLTENACQAVARDMLMVSMNNLRVAGYPIIFHVHDEAVSHVPKDFGSLEEFEKIMSITPEWAKDFPLSVEGFEAQRYRK